MSDEFKKLQTLINSKQAELRLKKSLKDTFGVWLYWMSKVKRPKYIWKIFFIIYWLLSSEWFWIPFSIFMTLKFSYFYLLGFLIPFIITKIFKPIGQGFLIFDAQKDEELFDGLWSNNLIGIMSTKIDESEMASKGIPEFIIDSYNHNWREELIKVYKPLESFENENISINKKKKILIIDDEFEIREVLKDYLSFDSFFNNFEIIFSDNGHHALNLVDRLKNDIRIIISDINHPGQNGLELLKTVKSKFPDTIFFIQSANLSEENLSLCQDLADQILRKPIVLTELNQLLKKYISA